MAAIIFTDVARSTELLYELGPERYEGVRRRHVAHLRAALHEHGGQEVKSLGDGLMAIVPSAAGGVAAAAAMQRRTAAQAQAARIDLRIRIGVAAGDVVEDESDFYGPAVVEAARLCPAATGGEILLTDLARRLAGERPGVGYEAVGPMVLKGIPEPVDVYRVGVVDGQRRRSRIAGDAQRSWRLRARRSRRRAGGDGARLGPGDRRRTTTGPARRRAGHWQEQARRRRRRPRPRPRRAGAVRALRSRRRGPAPAVRPGTAAVPDGRAARRAGRARRERRLPADRPAGARRAEPAPRRAGAVRTIPQETAWSCSTQSPRRSTTSPPNHRSSSCSTTSTGRRRRRCSSSATSSAGTATPR